MNEKLYQGYNPGEQEKAEDLLECMYMLWKQNTPPDRDRILSELMITPWEYQQLLNWLIRNGFLEEGDLSLTIRGKDHAAEILEKRRYVREFLKVVCNVDESVAESNAGRIEHVVDSHVMRGIRGFMRRGKISDRVIYRQDLTMLYEPGTYTFAAHLYDADTRYPRQFAPEAGDFSESVNLYVEDIGYFGWPLREESAEGAFWYMQDREWTQARRRDGQILIPSDVLKYTISGVIPTIEGEGLVAWMTSGKWPEESNIRTLNIHMW